MARERLKRREQCAWPMCEAHGDGHFMRVGGCLRLVFRDEQHEARKIFGVVLHGFCEDDAAVMVGSALSGNGSERFVLACQNFAYAARRIFRRHAFP